VVHEVEVHTFKGTIPIPNDGITFHSCLLTININKRFNIESVSKQGLKQQVGSSN
jgi:hypothetical protein